MLSRFFKTLVGSRSAVTDFTQCVEVLAWYHPECVPSQHMALRIRELGHIHYLSFSPKSLHGLAERPFLDLPKGVEGVFIPTYEDELLIQGFRNAWPAIQNELSDQQKSFISRSSIRKISDIEILGIAQSKQFSHERKEELRKIGKPTEIIELRTLDINAMVTKLNQFKSPETNMQWASFCGTYKHQKNTHNCASIVLDLLYEGGMGAMITSNNDLLGLAGTLLGVGYTYFTGYYWLHIIKNISFGLLFGRCIGGAYEGYTGIQSFLNLLSTQGKDNCGSILGLRVLSTCFSAIVGVIKPGPVVPAFLTIPRNVLDLAHQAKVDEENIALFRVPRAVEVKHEYGTFNSIVLQRT